eukprot:scaffold1875_cov339-Prasinococcus_capsulatus_cf.AAC.12
MAAAVRQSWVWPPGAYRKVCGMPTARAAPRSERQYPGCRCLVGLAFPWCVCAGGLDRAGVHEVAQKARQKLVVGTHGLLRGCPLPRRPIRRARWLLRLRLRLRLLPVERRAPARSLLVASWHSAPVVGRGPAPVSFLDLPALSRLRWWGRQRTESMFRPKGGPRLVGKPLANRQTFQRLWLWVQQERLLLHPRPTATAAAEVCPQPGECLRVWKPVPLQARSQLQPAPLERRSARRGGPRCAASSTAAAKGLVAMAPLNAQQPASARSATQASLVAPAGTVAAAAGTSATPTPRTTPPPPPAQAVRRGGSSGLLMYHAPCSRAARPRAGQALPVSATAARAALARPAQRYAAQFKRAAAVAPAPLEGGVAQKGSRSRQGERSKRSRPSHGLVGGENVGGPPRSPALSLSLSLGRLGDCEWRVHAICEANHTYLHLVSDREGRFVRQRAVSCARPARGQAAPGQVSGRRISVIKWRSLGRIGARLAPVRGAQALAAAAGPTCCCYSNASLPASESTRRKRPSQ